MSMAHGITHELLLVFSRQSLEIKEINFSLEKFSSALVNLPQAIQHASLKNQGNHAGNIDASSRIVFEH